MSGSDNKPFEPPPWEKEQFEELARRRAAERPDAAEPVRTAGPRHSGPPVAEPVKKDLPVETDLMLSRLKEQEAGSGQSLWTVGAVMTSIVAIIGTVLVVWGITGLATVSETGATGVTGGAIMIFFGLFFIGMGAWMGVRIMRQRGVL